MAIMTRTVFKEETRKGPKWAIIALSLVLILFLAIKTLCNTGQLQGSCGMCLAAEVPNNKHVVIISSTYFAKPVANYVAHTMVTLFNTETRIIPSFELVCLSKNGSHILTETAQTLRIRPGLWACKWTQYITKCEVAENPTFFALTEKGFATNQASELVFRYAEAKKYDVIACFSPLFYFERWQTLLVSLELFRFYGASIQVHYIQSILTEILDVLRVYEDRGVILIEPWSSLDVDDIQLGYDPNMELDMRNQAAAHTDCLLKYKVAAEFIIVGDYDDLLLPRFGRTYREEFRALLTLTPNSAGFIYQRYNANFTTSWKPSQYSLSELINRIGLTKGYVGEKSVIIPTRVHTLRPHKPGDVLLGYQMARIFPGTNVMVHLRKWRTVDGGYGFRKGPEDVESVTGHFGKLFHDKNLTETFMRLQNGTFYFDHIYKCYERLVFTTKIETCAGPALCDIPRMQGLQCAVAKKTFKHDRIGENIYAHHSKLPTLFVQKSEGCSM